MEDIETPAVPTPVRLRPQWQAWLVTAGALAAVVLCAGYLEVAVRSDIRDAIQVEPPSWSDPQVRAYASARSYFSFRRRSKLLKRALDMRSDGAITAAAASEYSVFGPHKDETSYALLAARAVPANSPLLPMYYLTAVHRIQKTSPDAIPLLREGLDRATLPKSTATLLMNLLRTVGKTQGLDAALRAYAEYDRRMPSAAHADNVQSQLASMLEQGHRQEDADRIRRYLATNASDPGVRKRARKHLGTGDSDGN